MTLSAARDIKKLTPEERAQIREIIFVKWGDPGFADWYVDYLIVKSIDYPREIFILTTPDDDWKHLAGREYKFNIKRGTAEILSLS